MPSENKPKQNNLKQQAGILLKPKNLLKTVAGQFPIASIATDLIDQIESHETDLRIENLETEVKCLVKLKALEDASPKTAAPLHDWSIPVREYFQRTVDIAVVYDGGFHSKAQRGQELVQPVAHACIIGDHEILTCKEALSLASHAAEHKHGKVIILAGMAWYGFDSEQPNKPSGLCVCRLSAMDGEKWREVAEFWRAHGLGELDPALISMPVRYSVSPWMGQEVGFIHLGEAENVLRGRESITKRQFDTSVISHFRRPVDDAIKTFVTGVLPGRVMHVGVPFFSRDGTLLGILSDTENYQSDAGRRAVVRSLLAHPRFMKPPTKKGANEHK